MKEVFEVAAGLEPAERRSYLEEACREDASMRIEVESLLEAHESPGPFLDSPPVEAKQWAEEWDGQSHYGQLGPYRLLEIAGQGGMGVVYRASRADKEFQRQVAIKVISREFSDEAMQSRFRQERQILAELDHPGITTLYDGGTTPDGLPYLVMEYVEGKPITEYFKEKECPLRERLLLFRQVCDAASYAHERKIVHRDLKPSNVLVTSQGAPKLLDFGIAKILKEQPAAGEAPASIASTRIMTPEYASPEQIRGEPVTEASDVYALGVILYELVAGRHPYTAGATSPEQVAQAACERDPPRPSSMTIRPDTPPEYRQKLSADLDNVLLKALEKQPARRYPTAKEFGEDLGRYLDGLPVLATNASWFRRAVRTLGRHRVAALSVGLAAVSIMALAYLQNRWSRENLLSTGDRPSPVAEANEYFERAELLSTAHWDPPRIIATLEKAVNADPRFTPARVSLGFFHLIMVDGGYSGDGRWLDRAEEQLQRALADDPDYKRTHAFLAAVSYYRHRCGETMTHAKAALRADPHDSDPAIWMINCMIMNDDHRGAKKLARELLERKSTDFPARMNLASILRDEGDLQGAIRESEKILEQNPNLVYSLATEAFAHLDQGDTATARSVLDRAPAERRENYLIRLPITLLLAHEGRREEAKSALTPDVLRWAELVPHCTLWVADILAVSGEGESAMEWVRRAVANGDRRRTWFERDPHLKSLRGRADFRSLIQSLDQKTW